MQHKTEEGLGSAFVDATREGTEEQQHTGWSCSLIRWLLSRPIPIVLEHLTLLLYCLRHWIYLGLYKPFQAAGPCMVSRCACNNQVNSTCVNQDRREESSNPQAYRKAWTNDHTKLIVTSALECFLDQIWDRSLFTEHEQPLSYPILRPNLDHIARPTP